MSGASSSHFSVARRQLAVRCPRPAKDAGGRILSIAGQQSAGACSGRIRLGLAEFGFVEGKNVLIESRWADGQYDQLPELLVDLIKRNVAVIMAGGPPAALAAKKATSTVPIVFTSGDNPVEIGLVASINRPGENVTGVHVFFTELESKKLGLLRELVPQAGVIAALVNQSRPAAKARPRNCRQPHKNLDNKFKSSVPPASRNSNQPSRLWHK